MNNPNPNPNRNRNANQKIDETVERDYWRGRYDKEGYYEAGRTFEDYEGAYRTGYEGPARYPDQDFDAAENDLKREWEAGKGKSQLAWEKVKGAARAAWDRVERAMPGDADKDGR